MAFNNQNPTIDASLGLIYRLNILWSRVDEPAQSGDFLKWNFALDRIFCNLMYRNKFEVIKDERTGRLKEVKLSEDDQAVCDNLNKQVDEAFLIVKNSKTMREREIANLKLYKALMLKDIGLRKFMHTLKLYIRETNNNPASSLWGG